MLLLERESVCVCVCVWCSSRQTKINMSILKISCCMFIIDRFYIVLFSALEQTQCAHM